MIVTRHKRGSTLWAIVAIVMFTLPADLFGQARAGRGETSQPARAPGPSGPYNPRDLGAARPFDASARAWVAMRLEGSIDIHMHTDPDIAPRPVDAIDVVKLSQKYRLRAIVLKNHYETTAAQAYILSKLYPDVQIIGSMTLDLTNGGVNPAAVEHMARLKGGYGKVLWFPTYDAESPATRQKKSFARVSRNGVLTPESQEVLALVAKYNLSLATGHLSPEESLLLIREARARGIQRIVVTHAVDEEMTVPQMLEAARMGAFVEIAKPVGGTTVEEYADAIRKVGPDSCLISETGVSFLPDELVGAFLVSLRQLGFTDGELDKMTKTNPAKWLGLPVQ